VGERLSATPVDGGDLKELADLKGTDARATCSRDRLVDPDMIDEGGLSLRRGGSTGRRPESSRSRELDDEGGFGGGRPS